jgi:hypothetical protein
MTGILKRGLASKALVLVALIAIGAIAAGGSASAKGPGLPEGGGGGETIEMTFGPKGGLRFIEQDGDGEILRGDDLTIVNETNPRQVGPHTFSLVQARDIPKDRAERRACFEPGNICAAIAEWHGARGNRPPTTELVEAGAAGWDTQGNLDQEGDSWVSEEKGGEITQPVTAAANKSIHFMCAIHPHMRGRLKVLNPLTK